MRLSLRNPSRATRDRLSTWFTAPRESVVKKPKLLRHAARYLLLAWFVAMNLIHLKPWHFSLDAHIYQRAANAYVAGADPWAAEHGGYLFAAAPPTLLPYVLTSVLPEPLAVAFWMIAGLSSALYIVRRLGLAWWWLLFPPLTLSVVVGNPQSIALALLLASRTPLTALATVFKLYAIVPALFKPRHVAASVIAIGLTWFVLPWDSFLDRLPEMTERLNQQSQGGFSAFGNPLLFVVTVLALVILRTRGWQWFAVPALWPSTQFHYSLYALPAVTPVVALGLSMPIRVAPPLIIIAYAAFVLGKEHRFPAAALLQRLRGSVRDLRGNS